MTGIPAATAAGCDPGGYGSGAPQLYVEMLAEAYAERYYVTFATSDDTARELTRESFAATDTRLPPRERTRLGASGSVLASHKVSGCITCCSPRRGR